MEEYIRVFLDVWSSANEWQYGALYICMLAGEKMGTLPKDLSGPAKEAQTGKGSANAYSGKKNRREFRQ